MTALLNTRFQRTDLEKVLEKLSQREKQVILLTEENTGLQETVRALQQSQTDLAGGHSGEPDKEREQLSQKLRALKTEFDSTVRQKDAELKELKETLQGLYVEGEKLSQEQGKDRKKMKEMKAKETKLEKEKTEVTEKVEQANKRIETLQLDLKAAERYKGESVLNYSFLPSPFFESTLAFRQNLGSSLRKSATAMLGESPNWRDSSKRAPREKPRSRYIAACDRLKYLPRRPADVASGTRLLLIEPSKKSAI